MTEASAPPRLFVAGGMPDDIAANLRVVDAKSGEAIAGVIEADAAAGRLTRYAMLDGNLVRNGDRFETIEERRQIRIEWIVDPNKLPEPAGAEQG